jgi:hypothetical protein
VCRKLRIFLRHIDAVRNPVQVLLVFVFVFVFVFVEFEIGSDGRMSSKNMTEAKGRVLVSPFMRTYSLNRALSVKRVANRPGA